MSSADRFQRLDALFRAAAKLPPADRERYLDAECAGDTSIKAEVLSLIASDEAGTGALDQPAIDPAVFKGAVEPPVPPQVGRYRIVRRIGSGGMGVVYEAEQDAPRRRVALKVINPGVATPAMLRRFEHEAEVLGRLHHVGIAQIFEAGSFDAGAGAQPFFAMEYVEGKTLTRYADDRGLRTSERLELLALVCDAVQHAHQRGVIHRDLKPGNILVKVEEDAGAPTREATNGARSASPPPRAGEGRGGGRRAAALGQPKVLDFGVARATDADIQTTTMQTNVGQLIGTIPYMSPEQASGDPSALDTRSDVYALGVVAYEVLAGRLPYELAQKTVPEAVRIIQEQEPRSLSTANRTLRGDVETIVGTALAKEKSRRYESAAAMADDIRRHLRDEPIAARPPSTWYQLRKFSRRNRALVAGVAAVFVVLTAGVIVSSVLAIGQSRARREAERQALIAEAVNEFLNEDLLAAVDPSRTADREITMREVLDAAAARIEGHFEDQPLVEAPVRHTLAKTYEGLGLLAEAEHHLQRCLALVRAHRGERHEDTLQATSDLAVVIGGQGRRDEAVASLEQVLPLMYEVLGEDHTVTLGTRHNLAVELLLLGEYERAALIFEDSLERRRRTLGDEDPETLSTINNLGSLYLSQGRYKEAEDLYLDSMEATIRVLGPEHPDSMLPMLNLASAYASQGQLEKASSLNLRILEIQRRVLGEAHPETLTSAHGLASVYLLRGRSAEAVPLLTEVLSMKREVLGDDHPDTLRAIHDLATAYGAIGRQQEAAPLLEEILEMQRHTQGERHPDTLRSMHTLAAMYMGLERYDEAEPLYVDSLTGRRELLGDRHIETLLSAATLSALYTKWERYAEAEALITPTVATIREMLPGHWYLGAFLRYEGQCLTGMERFEDAERVLLESHVLLETALGADHTQTQGTVSALVKLYEARGDDERAAEWRTRQVDGDD